MESNQASHRQEAKGVSKQFPSCYHSTLFNPKRRTKKEKNEEIPVVKEKKKKRTGKSGNKQITRSSSILNTFVGNCLETASLEFPHDPINKKDPLVKLKMRYKFVETVKKYLGVPYKKSCFQKGEEMYYYPIYLDCCGLIRRALLDMSRELGFCIGRWNQGYQVDTLPIVLEQSELKPGDMIFYSATYYSDKKKVSKHNMVHVEMFMGGETGEQSIGARK